MVRRSDLGIKIDVLSAIYIEAKPTLVMYMTRLSWKKNVEVLKDLVKRGLVKEYLEYNAKRYKLTDEGFNTMKIAEMLVEKLLK